MSRRNKKAGSRSSPTFVMKSEIKSDDHLIKKGCRLSQTLDGIMVGKLEAWRQARTAAKRRKIIEQVIHTMPGRFLKEVDPGYFAIVKGPVLHQKLGMRFHNLSYRVRNKPYRYDGTNPSKPRAKRGQTGCAMAKASPVDGAAATRIESTEDDDISTFSEESTGHNYECEVCYHPGKLLCCSTCTAVFHLECHRPILKGVPKGKKGCC